MVEINKEIDLRSPEFIASRRFIKPVLLKYLAVFLSLALISGAHYGAARYCDQLRSHLKANTAAVQNLKEEVPPLLDLSFQASLVKARSGLEQSFHSSSKPLHTYLVQARQLADLYHLDMELAMIDAGGKLLLKGTGRQINNMALYNRALEELPFIARAEITTINLNQEEKYHFEIQCVTKPQEGVEDN